MPLPPLVAGVRLSVTALSYDGTLSVALLADESITDLPIVARGVQAGFDTYSSSRSTAIGDAEPRQRDRSPA